MQAIQESNEHLEKAKSLFATAELTSESDEAFLEAQFAEIKATQALALAILHLADANKKHSELEAKLEAHEMRAKGRSMCEVCENWFDPEEGGGTSLDGIDFCSVHWAELKVAAGDPVIEEGV
jgi:hypothetical protein